MNRQPLNGFALDVLSYLLYRHRARNDAKINRKMKIIDTIIKENPLERDLNGELRGNNCSFNDIGIYLNRSNNCIIVNNNVGHPDHYSNEYGILLRGVHNKIYDNDLSYNGQDIYLQGGSDNNIISKNNCSHNYIN